MPKPYANKTPEEDNRFGSKHKEEKTSDEDVECECISTKVVASRQRCGRKEPECEWEDRWKTY